MNKKLFVFISTTLIALVFCLILCGCGNSLETRLKQMDECIGECKTATVSVTETDGGVTVYSQESKIVLNGTEATVDTKLKELNTDEVGFKESSSTKTEQIKTVPHVILTQDMIVFSQLNADSIVCIVEKANAQKLFGANVSASGDITVTCTFSDKQLLEVKCEFVSALHKAVTVLYTYGN